MTTIEGQTDHFKLLGDWSLAAGRSLQSKQTGFVHYYYGESQPPYEAIPLVENMLFVLALFRSRLMEQVQEAKALLASLLNFQNLVDRGTYGNFPIYLHQYPSCCDATIGLQLLTPFYWILTQFGNVLGVQLKDKLEQAIRSALEYSTAAHREKAFPYSIAVRLAAAQYAYGTLWKLSEWETEGRDQLAELSQKQLEGWVSTKHLGELSLGLQMAYPSLVDSPWHALWKYMEQSWLVQTGCYLGPCIREWQEREEPQTNVFDLFGGYFAGQFPRRATLISPCHLYGSLIQPSPDRFHTFSAPGVAGQFKGQPWKIVRTPAFAYTLLEKRSPSNPSVDNTYTPFRLVWGDLQRTHTFVCQGGSYQKVEFVDHGASVELLFDLLDDVSGEGTKQKKEIEFFIDFHPAIQFFLNGLSTSTFELGQELTIDMAGHMLALRFELLQGEGQFFGHVMRGNRPTQIDLKGPKRFHSYDWAIFLRTIRRQNGCRLRATLAFHSRDLSNNTMIY